MSQTVVVSRNVEEPDTKPFVAGTLGWREADLDDPAYSEMLANGRFEIINGVLVRMPPAYFSGNSAAMQLIIELSKQTTRPGRFASEVSLVLADDLVLEADFAWASPEDWDRHVQASSSVRKTDGFRTRLFLPPTLVIESVSVGHERHDRVNKFRWYAEFGVTNYWIVDGFKRKLDCFQLQENAYERIAGGKDNEQVALPVFEPVTVDLSKLWL